jgi:hypothetical protein
MMARHHVSEYTRQLADGTKVTVGEHHRTAAGANLLGDSGRRSPVESHRRARLKQQARARRRAALRRGGRAAKKGLVGIRRRGRQTKKLLKRGTRRLSRAARYASKNRRGTAACCLVAGVVEIGAGLLWSTAGLVFATLSILAALVSGGLLLGGGPSGGPKHAKDPGRAAVRARQRVRVVPSGPRRCSHCGARTAGSAVCNACSRRAVGK